MRKVAVDREMIDLSNEEIVRATKVLEFLKKHCPKDYQRALDYVDGINQEDKQ